MIVGLTISVNQNISLQPSHSFNSRSHIILHSLDILHHWSYITYKHFNKIEFLFYFTKCQFVPENTCDFELDISNMLDSWGDHHPQRDQPNLAIGQRRKQGFFGESSSYNLAIVKIWRFLKQNLATWDHSPKWPNVAGFHPTLPPPPLPNFFLWRIIRPFFFFWLPSDTNSLKKKEKACMKKTDFGGIKNPRKMPIVVKSPYLDNRIYRGHPETSRGSLNFLYSQIWLFPLVDDRPVWQTEKRPQCCVVCLQQYSDTPQGTQCELGELGENSVRI